LSSEFLNFPKLADKIGRKGACEVAAMTKILAEQSAEKRRVGVALIREADNLACQSWNEKMWSDGGPINPSPTVGQAVNGGFPWLEIKCSRCATSRDVERFPTYPLHAFMIPPAGWFAESVSVLRSARRLRYSS
jgi:hypothetical protein